MYRSALGYCVQNLSVKSKIGNSSMNQFIYAIVNIKYKYPLIMTRKNIYNLNSLKRHGDAQTHDLSNIEFFHVFHIFFFTSYENITF